MKSSVEVAFAYRIFELINVRSIFANYFPFLNSLSFMYQTINITFFTQF